MTATVQPVASPPALRLRAPSAANVALPGAAPRRLLGLGTAAQIAAVLALLAAGCALALTVNGYWVFVLANVALLAIVGIGLNVLIGLTGQVSFGHVGFYAIGAYTVAILTAKAGLSFWLAWPVAALMGAVAGALLALPALRAKGPYLAMITIAFGFIVENAIIEARSLTGGQNGLMGLTAPNLFGTVQGERAMALLAVLTAGAVLAGYAWLSRGTWGAAMRAVRDSETAAASIGLNPLTVKTVAFALSAACAAVAGGLFAPLSGFVTPHTFAFLQSILFVLVVMLGGAGSIAGPLVGALIVGLLPEWLASLEEYRLLFFGGLLLGVLWAAPDGVAGL
jgi:ABC-type branched-subunit amino acid transport system permease subunit